MRASVLVRYEFDIRESQRENRSDFNWCSPDTMAETIIRSIKRQSTENE